MLFSSKLVLTHLNKMITVKYDEKTGILLSTWKGDIDLNQIVDYIDSVRLNEAYPRRLKILSDSRDANFILRPGDLPKIVEANQKSLKQYDTIIDAMLVANPRDTALSVLYQELSAIPDYFFEIFSTPAKALMWLKNY